MTPQLQSPFSEGTINISQTIGFTSLGQAINTLLPLAIFGAAIMALIYMTLAALKYIAAGDSQESTKGARRMFTNAVVGLFLMALVVVAFQLIIALIPGLDEYFTILR
jgi:hypothetical protein